MEFDKNKIIGVKNITDHYCGFQGKTSRERYDFVFKPGATVPVPIEEVIAQWNDDNRLFWGFGEKEAPGYHAALYIQDGDLRKEFGLETAEYTQEILTMDKLLEYFQRAPRVLDLKRDMANKFVSTYDKRLLQKAISEGYINNHKAVVAAEEFLCQGFY